MGVIARTRSGAVTAVAVGALYLSASVALGQGAGRSAAPSGTPEQQTHPRMHPSAGRRHTAFTVAFTLADAPGQQGVVATDYQVEVSPPRHARAACRPPSPPWVDSGDQGARVRQRLPAPAPGWCEGRYAVTVRLQRGPYCPPPADGQPPQPCPKFASQSLEVGRTHFTVKRSGR
ncbi:MAG: hypothetical protein ACR2NB_03830 [Solirubrobacteraceae bacterium]